MVAELTQPLRNDSDGPEWGLRSIRAAPANRLNRSPHFAVSAQSHFALGALPTSSSNATRASGPDAVRRRAASARRTVGDGDCRAVRDSLKVGRRHSRQSQHGSHTPGAGKGLGASCGEGRRMNPPVGVATRAPTQHRGLRTLSPAGTNPLASPGGVEQGERTILVAEDDHSCRSALLQYFERVGLPGHRGRRRAVHAAGRLPAFGQPCHP